VQDETVRLPSSREERGDTEHLFLDWQGDLIDGQRIAFVTFAHPSASSSGQTPELLTRLVDPAPSYGRASQWRREEWSSAESPHHEYPPAPMDASSSSSWGFTPVVMLPVTQNLHGPPGAFCSAPPMAFMVAPVVYHWQQDQITASQHVSDKDRPHRPA
jgi:hypothetical protein